MGRQTQEQEMAVDFSIPSDCNDYVNKVASRICFVSQQTVTWVPVLFTNIIIS